MAAYPRKQTVAIFILCAFAVGGVGYYVYGQKSADTTGYQDQAKATVTVASEKLADNNDWQKQFLAAGGDNGAFKPSAAPVTAKKDENLAPIDTLGRDFLTKYMELRQSGLSDDSQSVADSMNAVAAANLNKLPSPKIYSSNNIAVSAGDQSNLTRYKNAIVSLFRDSLPKLNEAMLAQQAYENNDMSELALIDPVISGYKDSISILLKTPAPEPLAKYHVDLLNALSISLYNAESFRHMDTDPMRGLAAVSLEIVGIQNTMTAYADIQSYFISKGMPFES